MPIAHCPCPPVMRAVLNWIVNPSKARIHSNFPRHSSDSVTWILDIIPSASKSQADFDSMKSVDTKAIAQARSFGI